MNLMSTSKEKIEVIDQYLWYGYLLPEYPPSWLHDDARTPCIGTRYDSDSVNELSDKVFEKALQSSSSQCVVPISGGWDSRYILGHLCERQCNIVCMSFGAPGQLDYEIGSAIARLTNSNHVAVDLYDVEVTWSDIEAAAYRAPWTYMPEAFLHHKAYEIAVKGCSGGGSIWSGFLGEALTGGHFDFSHQKESLSKAAIMFANSQRKSKSLVEGEAKDRAFTDRLCGLADQSWKVTFRSQFDILVRQASGMAPAVLGLGTEWKSGGLRLDESDRSVDIIAPFIDRDWVKYWLYAPERALEKQGLYIEAASSRFPDLFSRPSKYTWGVANHQRMRQLLLRTQHSIRNRFHRHMPWLPIRSRLTDNYIDFQWAFRKRDDYIGVMERAIDVLKQREAVPWLDLDRIWREHYRGKRDHAQALKVLLGLAVNLEVHG